MARKSRKHNICQNSQTEIILPRKELTGIYARLSVEDNGYGSKDSMQNQIAYLMEYVEKNEEYLQLEEVYADNGTTGTNFDRAEWNRLINDVKESRIKCIIVKDFSRIGRNYIEVGNYLEKIFPFLGVRIISINDNYDSKKDDFQSGMLINSLTNIVNEYYARDISKKITQTKRTMFKNGEYASGVVPYGYKRTKDKRLIVDEECAVVVKKIFEWRMQSKGCPTIANFLNEMAIPSPGQYRYMNGNEAFKRSCDSKWKSKHVAGILKNPVYLGHMVQGKTRSSYFEQNGKMRYLPKEEWIIVENTHEALISQDQFDMAAEMAQRSTDKHFAILSANSEIPHTENPLKNKVFCGQCGRHMIRRGKVKKGVRDYCFFCNSSSEKIGVHCVNTYIHEEPLMEAILCVADQNMKLLGKWANRWDMRKHSDIRINVMKKEAAKRKDLTDTIETLRKQKQELYSDMKEGLLFQEEYEYEKERLSEKINRCEKELEAFQRKSELEEDIEGTLQEYREKVLAITNENNSWDLLDLLIGKITVFSPERIEVSFTFTDEIIHMGNCITEEVIR